MKILIAKEAGFCFGAERASKLILSKKGKEKVFTLGPLVHNGEFIKYLETRNVFVASDLEDIKSDKVAIRSHGVSKELEEELKAKDFKLIDATCPYVKRVQKLAEKLEKEGYKVLIFGETIHSEVQGIKSYAPKAIIIKGIEDVKKIIKGSPDARQSKVGISLGLKKIALISQTTQNLEEFEKLASFLRANYRNPKIFNTICDATEKRQEAARQLAQKVDIMIVIGGKNSSNTTRLKEICEEIVLTHHIENEKELQKNWFLKVKSVGVTAGASTPDFSIKAVLNRIKNYA